MGADGDRFEKRLAGWKRALPFEGARLTLIKSILGNLPIYHMSLKTIPTSVAKWLETIQFRFFWGNWEESRRFHLVVWEETKKPFPQGGLRLRSLVEMNITLQGFREEGML